MRFDRCHDNCITRYEWVMTETTVIFCCACRQDVKARFTGGEEIYPRWPDLYKLPFWKCDVCSNYVGCHHKTNNRTQPLGVIPTKEIRDARKHIHKLLDPLWTDGKMDRKTLYAKLTDDLGWKYHTANIKSIEEARDVYKLLRKYGNEVKFSPGKDNE